MRRLPLYEQPPPAAVELAEPLTVDHSCKRCVLHDSKQKTVCLSAEGEPGGLLVVGDAPGRAEDYAGRPLLGKAGDLVRSLVANYWKGPVAYDYAVRCFAGREVKYDKILDACRGYLAATVREVQPSRVIALGTVAVAGLLDRSIVPQMQRKSYAFLTRTGGKPVPVFAVPHPSSALRNRFVREWLNEDFKWALTAEPELPPWSATVHVVETVEDARLAIAYVRSVGTPVGFDCETAGPLHDPSFRIVALSICAEDDAESFLWPREALLNPQVALPLREWLADAEAPKSGTNLKFDTQAVLCEFGIWVEGIVSDARLMMKLVDPEALAKLAKMSERIGMGGMKEENADAKDRAVKTVRGIIAAEKRYVKARAGLMEKISAEPSDKKRATLMKKLDALEVPPPLSSVGVDAPLEKIVRSDDYKSDTWVYAVLDKLDRDIMHRYNARDSVAASKLTNTYAQVIAAQPNLQMVWDRIVRGASDALAQVEATGLPVDRDSVLIFDRHLAAREAELEQKLKSFVDLNWNSPTQLREYLFVTLGLPSVELTDTGLESTAKETLLHLVGQHPVIEPLIDYRKVTKLRGTYAQGMLPHIRIDGRIHPSILLDGAATGRTSCTDPNLQNIPRADSPEGKMARDVFVAKPGWVFVQLDYSQLELRIAAMLSDDGVMIDVFASGADFHMATAQMISKVAWGIEPDKVTKAERSKAKNVNFGVLYGKTASSLAKEWGVSTSDAQRVMDAILGRFKKLDRWRKERLAEGRRTGFVYTAWDGQVARRRSLWRIADQEDGARITAENGTVNTPIQGTASDYCVASIAACTDWLNEYNRRQPTTSVELCLPVHDSLLFHVRLGHEAAVIENARRIMQGWPSGRVPLLVDVETGRSWGSLEKLKEAA